MLRRQWGAAATSALIAIVISAVALSMPVSDSPPTLEMNRAKFHRNDFVSNDAEYQSVVRRLEEEAANSVENPNNYVSNDVPLDEIIRRFFNEQPAPEERQTNTELAGSEQRGDGDESASQQDNSEEPIEEKESEINPTVTATIDTNSHHQSSDESDSSRVPLVTATTTSTTATPAPEREECYICIADMEERDEYQLDQCTHKFHKSCFAKWVNYRLEAKQIEGSSSVDCPVCGRLGHEADHYTDLADAEDVKRAQQLH